MLIHYKIFSVVNILNSKVIFTKSYHSRPLFFCSMEFITMIPILKINITITRHIKNKCTKVFFSRLYKMYRTSIYSI